PRDLSTPALRMADGGWRMTNDPADRLIRNPRSAGWPGHRLRCPGRAVTRGIGSTLADGRGVAPPAPSCGCAARTTRTLSGLPEGPGPNLWVTQRVPDREREFHGGSR